MEACGNLFESAAHKILLKLNEILDQHKSRERWGSSGRFVSSDSSQFYLRWLLCFASPHACINIYIYIYMYIERERSIYIHIYIYIYIYIYVYVYGAVYLIQ